MFVVKRTNTGSCFHRPWGLSIEQGHNSWHQVWYVSIILGFRATRRNLRFQVLVHVGRKEREDKAILAFISHLFFLVRGNGYNKPRSTIHISIHPIYNGQGYLLLCYLGDISMSTQPLENRKFLYSGRARMSWTGSAMMSHVPVFMLVSIPYNVIIGRTKHSPRMFK